MTSQVFFTLTVQNLVSQGAPVTYQDVKAGNSENMYQALLKLEGSGRDFRFKAYRLTKKHHQIYSVNGLHQNGETNLHWTMRIGDMDTFADTYVDNIIPEMGKTYFLVYEEANE